MFGQQLFLIIQPGVLTYLLHFRSFRGVAVEALLQQILYVFALDSVKIELVLPHLVYAKWNVIQVKGILFSQHHIQSDSGLPDINLCLVLRLIAELV